MVLLGLAVLLTFVSFALINNTIRLTIYSKRFLIHTMKLVGASWGFIRRPFMWRNFWIGVLAGLIADSILWCAAYWLVSYEPDLIKLVTFNVMLTVSGAVLIFGVCITCTLYCSIYRLIRGIYRIKPLRESWGHQYFFKSDALGSTFYTC